MSSATSNSLRKFAAKPASCCQFPGCESDGEFLGPAREIPASMQRAGWEGDAGNTTARPRYCLQHIRLINSGWNFFDGMSADEIHAFERDAITGHRPVKNTNMRLGNTSFDEIERTYQAAFKMRFGHDAPHAERPPEQHNLPEDVQQAFDTLELDYPTTRERLKKTYRALAKQFHPDHQAADKRREAEETLKQINLAYQLLKNSEWLD